MTPVFLFLVTTLPGIALLFIWVGSGFPFSGIPAKKVEEYKEYESALALASGWFSPTVDLCTECGCDDAPTFDMYLYGVRKCKWCAEFANITYHLRFNGVRRLKK